MSQGTKKWVPHGVVVLWLLFIGLTVWLHARRAVLPPIADAFLYFEKGHNFWAALHTQKFLNPLNVEPTSRGPGTILMSAPLGFDPDFRRFFFRSVFFPIVCVTVALYMAAFDNSARDSTHWNLALLAIFLSGLPLFYHFENSDALSGPVYWGLADNFLAGISALAAGSSIRSIKNRSLKWWLLGISFTGLALLTKPAGAIVMVGIDLGWSAALVIEYLLSGKREKRITGRFLGLGTLLAAALQGGLVELCLHSKYLSSGSIILGQTSLRWFQTYFRSNITLRLLHIIVLHNFGYILPATTILVLIIGTINRRHRRDSLHATLEDSPRFLLSYAVAFAAILFIGLWFWIIATDIGQDRYFYPFASAAIICAAPGILDLMEDMGTRWRWFVRILWVVPCLNLAFLLVQRSPSTPWQFWSGVSLSSGEQAREVKQAKTLLDRVRKSGKNAVAFAFVSSAAFTFSSVAVYANLLEPEKPSFVIRLPIDNLTEPVYRMSDMLTSDFIVFPPISDKTTRESILSTTSIHNFGEEGVALQAWFSGLGSSDGIAEVSETSVRVLEVADRDRLRTSLERFLARRSWPERFIEVNGTER